MVPHEMRYTAGADACGIDSLNTMRVSVCLSDLERTPVSRLLFECASERLILSCLVFIFICVVNQLF